MNVNYHLTLATASSSYRVHLTPTHNQSNALVTIGNKHYSLFGDQKGLSWLHAKIGMLSSKSFKDIESFKAALLTPQEAASTPELIQSLALKILHIKSTEDLSAKAKWERAVKHAQEIGKGMGRMDKAHVRGRLIGEDYYREVIGAKDESIPLIDNKLMLWKEDKQNDLSYPEWEKSKTQEWKDSGTKLGFIEWVSREDWKKSGSTDSYEKWDLKRVWTRMEVKDPFEKWEKEDAEFRASLRKKETPHLTPTKFEELFNAHISSGSTLSLTNFEKLQQWKNSGSTDDFGMWVKTEEWKKEVPKGSPSLQEWMAKKERKLVERWEGSGLKDAGMSFKDWQLQQDDSAMVEAQAFIRLNSTQKNYYNVTFQTNSEGKTIALRNGKPYCTAHDKTLHSGDGFAIFVVSPDKKVYAASHIGAVFHHSSFLSDGAVMAGGEIKTDKSGQVIYISSKSGHYRPSDEENLVMLTHFKSQGVDLSKAVFSCYTQQGKTKSYVNAEHYLKILERVNSQRASFRIHLTHQDSVQNSQSLAGCPQLMLLNDKGEFYTGDTRLFDVFAHEQMNQVKIEKLKARLEKLTSETNQLKQVKGLKRHQTKRTQQIIQNQAVQEELQQKIEQLEFSPGRQEIKGGGVFTFDAARTSVKIDAKIGDYCLNEKEIVFTLNHLRQQRIELSNIQLSTYEEKKQTKTDHPNAFDYLKQIISKKNSKVPE